MSELDGVGEAVTGGMVGRAVEPKAGEVGVDGHTHEAACLNCGTALTGDYCHACGQRAHVHRTLGAFFHDLLHGALHFEGKTWRTLPMLAWRPGELTRRYIDGERARFVSPMALFLFSVFLMFAVASLTHTFDTAGAINGTADIQQELAKAERQVERLSAERDAAMAAHRPTDKIDERLADAKEDVATFGKLKSAGVRTDVNGELKEAPGWIRKPIDNLRENPELAFYKLKTSAYKFSWALIPISVPFLWLLFPFSRRFRLYDHTVFVTYSLAFMSLLMIAGMIMGSAGAAGLAGLLFLVPPFHFYRQLKGAYGLGRVGALLRTTLLTLFAGIALLLFVAVLAGLNIG